MIFVNDLWTLHDIPSWLEHVAAGVDGIGLADVVFPAFLFIVGLSLPFALQARQQKGASQWQQIRHVVQRSLALLIMGVFLVNGEYIHEAATGLSRGAWNTICCISFILIWNRYPKSFPILRLNILKTIAMIALLLLVVIYRGGPQEPLSYFQTRWWGILGLIGWSYLAAALVTVWSDHQILRTFIGWMFFVLLSLFHHAHLLPEWLHFIPEAIRGGTLTALVLGGVLTAQVFQRFQGKEAVFKLSALYLGTAAVWILGSMMTRPYWGLAKLGATPAWLFLCSAFTLLAFLFIYWLTDQQAKEKWFVLIRPAGTHTLLTYLIPYFIYAGLTLLPLHLPVWLLTGSLGLLKSLGFALVCVGVTQLITRWGIQLKL